MPESTKFDPRLHEILLRETGSPEGVYFPSEEARVTEIPVIAKLADGSIPTDGLRIIARFGSNSRQQVVTGRVSLDGLLNVRRNENVRTLKAARKGHQSLTFALRDTAASQEILRTEIGAGAPTGRGVVVGFPDVGFDFQHANFKNTDGGTRLLFLWDQRGGSHPNSPEPFGYGREFSRHQINSALATPDPYATLGYDPADADSDRTGTHGTHVADVGVGNGSAPGASPGVAPEADIIFVHLRPDDTQPQHTMGDSVRLLEAVRYIVDRAGDRPCVINISQGMTAGSHDGTTPFEQALDSLLDERPGLACAMSTGNYAVADLHSSGKLQTGEYKDLQWRVTPGNDEVAEMDIWVPGSDQVTLELIGPDQQTLACVPPGTSEVVRERERVIASIYNRQRDPNNLDNNINLYLWADAPIGVWTVRLHGDRVVDGTYHAWIERDDPASQSRFLPQLGTPETTTNTICNGKKTIAVAAYDARNAAHPILIFSSSGLTRDLRQKPDLSAPGTGIRAARSSRWLGGAREMNALTVKSGTSMAAPAVAGTIALMFEAVEPYRLSIDETRQILFENVRKGPPWNEDDHLRYGWGRVDAAASIRAARHLALERLRQAQAAELAAAIPAVALASQVKSATTANAVLSERDARSKCSLLHPHEATSITQTAAVATETAVYAPERIRSQQNSGEWCGGESRAMADQGEALVASLLGERRQSSPLREHSLSTPTLVEDVGSAIVEISMVREIPVSPEENFDDVVSWLASLAILGTGQTTRRSVRGEGVFADILEPEAAESLALAEHFHIKKELDSTTSLLVSAAHATVMEPSNMNPGYIGAATDDLLVDSSPDGLQTLLSDLLLSKYAGFLSRVGLANRRAHANDRIRLALVDLTDSKLNKPEFAGWGSTVTIYGASVPKILALYALHQLRFDLSHIAKQGSITNTADLVKAAQAHWQKSSFEGKPKFTELFDFIESTNPVEINFQAWLGSTFDIDDPCDVNRLMLALGFRYIASVALRSGLHHPQRGGLWLGSPYKCKGERPRWRDHPRNVRTHEATALSVATYFALLARGQLVDDANSKEMLTRLEGACEITPRGFLEGLTALGDVIRTARKCGVFDPFFHDCFLVERSRFRYVAIALTSDEELPLDQLIQDLDQLIQQKNP